MKMLGMDLASKPDESSLVLHTRPGYTFVAEIPRDMGSPVKMYTEGERLIIDMEDGSRVWCRLADLKT